MHRTAGSSYSYRVVVMRNTTVGSSISFAQTRVVSTVNFSQGVTIADMDGDGKPDILAGNWSPGSVSVIRNLSTPGNVSLASRVDFATGISARNLAVGDIDGDGKTDVVVASANVAAVFRNTSTIGSISFAPRQNYTFGSNGWVVGLTDIDGDGKPDMLFPNGQNLSILRNASTSGTIAFDTKMDISGFTGAYGIAAGDMDGDGKPDLAVSNSGNATLSLLRNQINDPVVVKLCPPLASTTITANASGTVYQWQVDSGGGFTNLLNNANHVGATSSSLQLSNIPSAWNGHIYRCLVDGVGAGFYRINFTNEWTGTTGTGWEQASNWSCGVAPDANTDIVITSGTVIISSNVVIRTLALAPGVTLTIAPGNTLTVTH